MKITRHSVLGGIGNTPLVNLQKVVPPGSGRIVAKREEGIFTGASSGANVVAAIRVARRLGPRATVATIIVDSGLRYLSTDVYAGKPDA